MYSGINRIKFNDTGDRTVNYTDFISGHIQNTEKLVISRSFHDGKFCGIFATSKLYSPKPARTWGIRENYDSFVACVKEKWKWINVRSENVYSFACDEKFGFGVFLMDGYGRTQTILRGAENVKKNGTTVLWLRYVLLVIQHFISSWWRTQRNAMEKCRGGLLVTRGKEWMMKYRRDTETDILS